MGEIKTSMKIFRICQKCNKEYELDLTESGEAVSFLLCPLCGERDDPWVRVEIANEIDSLEEILRKTHILARFVEDINKLTWWERLKTIFIGFGSNREQK